MDRISVQHESERKLMNKKILGTSLVNLNSSKSEITSTPNTEANTSCGRHKLQRNIGIKFIVLLLFPWLLTACSTTSELQPFPKLPQQDQQIFESKAPQVYHIGVGDTLRIEVQKRSNFDALLTLQDIPVSSMGTIFIPLLGDIQVKGMTERELRRELTKRLATYFRQPLISITVTSSKSMRIFVLGSVKKPGIYPLDINTSMTVLEMILVAGGQTKDADLSRIVLMRKRSSTQQVKQPPLGTTVDIYALLRQAETRQNITLEPGDVIYVPDTALASNADYIGKIGKILSPFTKLIGIIGDVIFLNSK